jgi:hypothetical protein
MKTRERGHQMSPIKSFFGQNLHAVRREGVELIDFTPKEMGALITYASSLPQRVSTEILSEVPPQIKIVYQSEDDAKLAEQIITSRVGIKSKDRPSLDGKSKEDI